MSDSEDERTATELEALRSELGLGGLQIASLPSVWQPRDVIPITLDVDGNQMSVWVPPAAKHAYRQKFRELARREKRRAADAGNAANTSQLIGGSIGGALATSGVIALATATGPMAIAAVIATCLGATIAVFGLAAGHWMNGKKFELEERMERYAALGEELN